MRDKEYRDIVAVYEASLIGYVITLNTLIQIDAIPLHKILFTSLTETSLHITTLFGYVKLNTIFLSKKMSLAHEVDQLG